MALAFTACAPDAPHDNPLDPSSSFFTGTGSVRGVVALLRDPREGIPSAQVCILPSGPIVLTAADGSFVLSSVPTGSVDLTAGKDGFRPDTLTVQIEAGNAASIDFRLDALPTVTLQRIVTRKIDAYFP